MTDVAERRRAMVAEKKARRPKPSRAHVATPPEDAPLCVVTTERAFIGGVVVKKGDLVRPAGKVEQRPTGPGGALEWPKGLMPVDALEKDARAKALKGQRATAAKRPSKPKPTRHAPKHAKETDNDVI